jgi:hypothetical protein
MGKKRAAELSNRQLEIMEQLPEKAKSIYDANRKKSTKYSFQINRYSI